MDLVPKDHDVSHRFPSGGSFCGVRQLSAATDCLWGAAERVGCRAVLAILAESWIVELMIGRPGVGGSTTGDQNPRARLTALGCLVFREYVLSCNSGLLVPVSESFLMS